MNQIIVRPLTYTDFAGWLPLWNDNNLGENDEEITRETWRRILSDDEKVYGICAEQNSNILGITHYILHPTTGHIKPVCYVQDVFVSKEHRGKGIGRKMIEEVIKIGISEEWARMYWLTQEDNEAAKALYKNLGIKLDFDFYVLPIS